MNQRRWCCLVIGILLAACSQAPVNPPAELGGLPLELSLRQRSSQEVPGSAGRLRIELGDVSGGQVVIRLVDTPGGLELASRALRRGDQIPFSFAGQACRLELLRLDNALVGEDFATVRLSTDSAAAEVTVAAEIEALLADLAAMSGTRFIRNDSTYEAPAAVEHLRGKWQRAAADIDSAEAFIDRLASRSSTSGVAYRIRQPDGSEMEAGPFLHERLRSLRAAR
jgi:hypothetical protein